MNVANIIIREEGGIIDVGLNGAEGTTDVQFVGVQYSEWCGLK